MVALADSDNIWHTLGRLEEGLRRLEERLSSLEATMLENQRQTNTAILENQRRVDAALLDVRAGMRDLNQRIDRLFYTIIAVGGAMIVATFASRFVDS